MSLLSVMISVSEGFISLLDLIEEKTAQGKHCTFRLVYSGPPGGEMNSIGVATDFKEPTGEYLEVHAGRHLLRVPKDMYDSCDGQRIVVRGPHGVCFVREDSSHDAK